MTPEEELKKLSEALLDHTINMIRAAIYEEREACAKVAEEYVDDFKVLAMSIAKVIRERGK